MPVGLAGLLGERRRDRQKHASRLSESTVKGRKAQIIADRETKPAPGKLGRYGVLAGCVTARFPVALAVGEVDVEHVDFVVTRRDLTLRVDEKAAVHGAIRRNLEGERPDMEP